MSGRGAIHVLALGALAVWAPAVFAAPDANELIARLARTAPASISFAEARFSSLLREPLMVAGELGYEGPGTLERRVLQPYRETTTVRGDSVSVEREGEEPRTFALSRSPELKGFLSAFGSLLAGDSKALHAAFTVAATGDDDAWQLELTPLDARARRRLRTIVIHGSGAEPRCLATLDTQGGGSVMLVGAAATWSIASSASLDDVLAKCGAE